MLKRSIVLVTVIGVNLTGFQAFAASKGIGSKRASADRISAKGTTDKKVKTEGFYKKSLGNIQKKK